MKKKTFKDIVHNLPPLKKVEDNIPLPYVFDLLWDAKFGKDLELLRDKHKTAIMRYLAERGFDAKEWGER